MKPRAKQAFSSSWPPSGAHVVARFQCGSYVTTRYGVEFKGYLHDSVGEEIPGRFLGARLMTLAERADFDELCAAPLELS